jgi:hypothetical protein
VRELRSLGSVRGVSGNRYPYRDPGSKAAIPLGEKRRRNMATITHGIKKYSVVCYAKTGNERAPAARILLSLFRYKERKRNCSASQ